MNTFDLSRWLWDFYSWATVLMSVALVANFLIAQPARRMVIAWSTAWGLLALSLLTAVPNWSQYSFASLPTPKSVEEPETFSAPNAPPKFEKKSQQPQQQIAFPPPNMAVVEPTLPATISIDWQGIAMTALLLGSVFVVCWLAIGAWQVRRLCASASPAPDEINRILSELSPGNLPGSQLGISKNLPVAVAVGLARPWILLPQALTHANREQARSVLAHELAHVANRDLWLLAILRGLMILLWPHPLFWLFRRQVRLDQELLADAAAAELTSRGTYAEQLVALARSAVERRVPRLASSVGLWESPSQLKERIALLLDDKLTILRNCSRSWRIGSAGMLAVLALALSLVTLTPRAAESRADTETATIQLASSVPPEQFAELIKQAETKDGFAYAVGDLVAAAIKPSQLPFVSDKRLAAIRYDFVLFVNEYTPANIAQERKAELLTGLRDHAQEHLELPGKPIIKNRDLNSIYLRDINNIYLDFNDRIKTLKWELWMALTREPLSKESLAKREAQRDWMRQTISDQPTHSHYTHEQILKDLEAKFADPLCVIFDRPMSDEAFAKFQSEINNWLAGIPKPNSLGMTKSTKDTQLPYMVHHFLWEAMRAQYSGEQGRNLFPQFDDDEIGGYGAESRTIHLGFASNRANESSSLSLSAFEESGNAINADTGYMADTTVKGDFGFSARDMEIIALNGAKLLPLQVSNWMEADEISVEDLKSRLTSSGVDEVDLGAFLQLKREQFIQDFQQGHVEASFTYTQNLDDALDLWEARQDGEGPYVAVLTNEGNIAVAHLTDLRDKNHGSFYVRTRVRPKPVTDETAGGINAPAGAVAQVARKPELKSESQAKSETHSAKPPKLLYLAWQSDDLLQPQLGKAKLWNRDGKVFGATQQFLVRIGNIGFAQPIDGLPPLVLFFEVDRAIDAPVNVALTVDGHDIIYTASARTSPVDGINVSAIEPLQSELPSWPDSVSLQLTYALENWQIIKRINSVDSLPIEVAEGVRWYLDPARALEPDPQTGRLRRAEGKTAGVLELSESVQKGLIAYGVRLYLRGKSTPMRESHVTVVTRKDGNHTIRISEAFKDVSQIDRVEFVRQRRAVEVIDDMPLRLDLLPKDNKPLVIEQRNASYEDGMFAPDEGLDEMRREQYPKIEYSPIPSESIPGF